MWKDKVLKKEAQQPPPPPEPKQHLLQGSDMRALEKVANVTSLYSPGFDERVLNPDLARAAVLREWTARQQGAIRKPFWAYRSDKSHEEYVYNSVHASLETNTPWLISDEAKERHKCGNYFSVDPLHLLPGTIKYFGPSAVTADLGKIYAKAAALGEALRRACPIERMDLSDAYNAMTKSTNFGSPFYTSDWVNDPAAIEYLATFAKAVDRQDGDTILTYLKSPSVTYSRVVPSGPVRSSETKGRRTFAATKTDSLLSKAYSLPIIRAWQSMANHDKVWARSFAYYVGWQRYGATMMVDTDCDNVLSLDYSGFDQSVKSDARDVVFTCLSTWFNDDPFLPLLFTAMDEREIITPYGLLKSKTDMGLESGVGFTGIIGSVWNTLVQMCMCEELGITPKAAYSYGDDAFLSWDGSAVPVEEFARVARSYGLVVHADKQEYDSQNSSCPNPHGTFLQKRGDRTQWGIHPIMRMLPRLMFSDLVGSNDAPPDGDHVHPWTSEVLDTISALEELRYHPDFTRFVRMVVDHHPCHMDPRTFMDFARIKRRDASGGQDVQKGVETFHTTNVIVDYYLEKGIDLTEPYSPWKSESLYKMMLTARWVHTSSVRGLTPNADQVRQHYNGEKVLWDKTQLATSNFVGTHKHGDLGRVVMEWQHRHGLVATKGDVTMLARGANPSLGFRSAERQAFSNLTSAEKAAVRMGLPNVHAIINTPVPTTDAYHMVTSLIPHEGVEWEVWYDITMA